MKIFNIFGDDGMETITKMDFGDDMTSYTNLSTGESIRKMDFGDFQTYTNSKTGKTTTVWGKEDDDIVNIFKR